MPLNDKAPEYNWYLFASHDLETVRMLMRDEGYPEIIICHMHQAIEKSLKGKISESAGIFPFIHDIERLYKILSEKDESCQGLEKVVISLQAFYVNTRLE